MRLRLANWREGNVQGWMQLGDMFAKRAHQPDKALAAYREALALLPPERRAELLRQMPAEYQMSASKG